LQVHAASGTLNAVPFLNSCLRPPGIFNAFRGAYEISVWPQVEQVYLAVLSLRHPNISSSFRVFTFHLAAVTDPEVLAARAAAEAAASAAATTAAAKPTTAAASAAAAVAAAGPVLNPLLQPRVVLAVTLPALDAAAYGGRAKVLADFKTIVAGTAVLDGPEWVLANLTSTKPVIINATVGVSDESAFKGSSKQPNTQLRLSNHGYSLLCLMLHATTFSPTAQLWFPANYSLLPSMFEGLCAMDYFLFLLNNLPGLALSRDGIVGFDVTGAKVVCTHTALACRDPT
jgi:hypothetical protein